MAKNEFLPFGIAEGANVLSNQEYERLAARFNGFISGVAKSKELNTVWRQSSVMSSALAQFIVDSDNQDLLDNGDVASIKTRLVTAIKQTISGVGYVTTAAMNLELNKKIDKANISGVKGNDNDKVPSLNLFTVEISKLAALGYSYSKIESDGRYQPKGEYATSQALNDGLSKKFDKSGGTVTGALVATGNITGNGDVIQVVNSKNNQAIQLDVTNDGVVRINSRVSGGATLNHAFPSSGGTLYSTGNTTKDSNGFLRTGSATALTTGQVVQTTGSSTTNVMSQKAVTDLVVASSYPVGAPIPWPQPVPPSGFLACNGQAFDKTTYPLLGSVYPTGVLPDLRGEFIRGWDDGRGVDAGREILSAQSDLFKAHHHSFTFFAGYAAGGGTGAVYDFNGSAGRDTDDTGGNETRPRNIAFNYIVRAV